MKNKNKPIFFIKNKRKLSPIFYEKKNKPIFCEKSLCYVFYIFFIVIKGITIIVLAEVCLVLKCRDLMIGWSKLMNDDDG